MEWVNVRQFRIYIQCSFKSPWILIYTRLGQVLAWWGVSFISCDPCSMTPTVLDLVELIECESIPIITNNVIIRITVHTLGWSMIHVWHHPLDGGRISLAWFWLSCSAACWCVGMPWPWFAFWSGWSVGSRAACWPPTGCIGMFWPLKAGGNVAQFSCGAVQPDPALRRVDWKRCHAVIVGSLIVGSSNGNMPDRVCRCCV